MRNFQDTYETRKRSFISAFSICMTVPLKELQNHSGKSFFESATKIAENAINVFNYYFSN